MSNAVSAMLGARAAALREWQAASRRYPQGSAELGLALTKLNEARAASDAAVVAALRVELQRDPDAVGYRDAQAPDGFKPTLEIIRLFMHAPQKPNPEPRLNLRRPARFEDLLDLVGDADRRAALANWVLAGHLHDQVAGGDARLLRAAEAAGHMTAEERAAGEALVAEGVDTGVPDPQWAETVDRAPAPIVRLGIGGGIDPELYARALGRSEA